jgi:hypothetical protein
MIHEMVAADLADARRDDLCRKEGFRILNHHE